MQVLQNFTDFLGNSWGRAAHGIDSIDNRIAPPLTAIAHGNSSVTNVNLKENLQSSHTLLLLVLYI